MPRATWEKEHMKYAMCFFPFVGAVLGLITFLAYGLLKRLDVGEVLRGTILTLLPILITGGIHLDGFIDTMDARNSYKDRVAKLEILKDPHIGAFALIKTIAYCLAMFGFMNEVNDHILGVICVGYVLSRSLSGLSVVYFKGAKAEGLLATFSSSAHKRSVRIVLFIYLFICFVAMVYLQPVVGFGTFVISIVVFFYYKRMAYKEFGGITGDIAGYFLQLCELFVVITAVVVDKLLSM